MRILNVKLEHDMVQGAVAAVIEKKLRNSLSPDHLEIVDESERHRGHMGWREGGETHFRITVVADAFRGRSRVDRHRQVNEILSDELAGPVHALSVRAQTPDEASGNESGA